MNRKQKKTGAFIHTLLAAGTVLLLFSFTPVEKRGGGGLIISDSLTPPASAMLFLLDSMRHHLTSDKKFNSEEERMIEQNKKNMASYLATLPDSLKNTCTGKKCIIFADIDKSVQRMYLYILGELRDSFNVSTGMAEEYETPTLNMHPEGPLAIKHTSKKFPGGNYKGMGNMPYSVFLSNGYAIHGTTIGNISKLGKKASHGCVRLHPDNGKYFYALVKIAGLKLTWVTIRESIENKAPE